MKEAVVLNENLACVLGALLRDIRQHLDQKFKPYELTRYEWLTLAKLRCENQISQSILKDYMGIDTSYITKVIDKLEEKGYVTREIDPNDRRNRIIKLKTKTAPNLKNIFKILEEFNTEVQEEVNIKQLTDLYTTLNAMRQKVVSLK